MSQHSFEGGIIDPGDLPASEVSLVELAGITNVWLLANGTTFSEKDVNQLKRQDGVLVSDDPVVTQVTLSRRAVEAIEPEAAAALELEGDLAPYYSWPTLALTMDGGYYFNSAATVFLFMREELFEEGDSDENIAIETSLETGETSAIRTCLRPLDKSPKIYELKNYSEKQIAEFASRSYYERLHPSKPPLVSAREAAALTAIMGSIDKIVAFDQQQTSTGDTS
jgi:hypothetical protein